MFAFKSILGTLLSPLSVAGILGMVALLLLLTTRGRRTGMVLLGGLILIGYALGTSPVARLVIAPLENGYVAVKDPVLEGSGEVTWVVVLGAGSTPDVRASTTAWLSGEGLHRVVEGIRIWRTLPSARLHLSGWGAGDTISYAEIAVTAAASLGVPPERIVFATDPRDTQEEALAVARILAPGEPFFLVTGAAHMRRSLLHFRKAGLNPIPAPAAFYSTPHPFLGLRDLVPDPANYQTVDRAVHEYLGLIWAKYFLYRNGAQ